MKICIYCNKKRNYKKIRVNNDKANFIEERICCKDTKIYKKISKEISGWHEQKVSYLKGEI